VSAVTVQWAVLALLAAWSLVSAFRRLFPTTARRAQARLARTVARAPFPVQLRRLARRLEPRSTQGNSCASGTSCSSCGGCSAALSASAPAAQPLRFRPKAP
jgi:hypothetical protein